MCYTALSLPLCIIDIPLNQIKSWHHLFAWPWQSLWVCVLYISGGSVFCRLVVCTSPVSGASLSNVLAHIKLYRSAVAFQAHIDDLLLGSVCWSAPRVIIHWNSQHVKVPRSIISPVFLYCKKWFLIPIFNGSILFLPCDHAKNKMGLCLNFLIDKRLH